MADPTPRRARSRLEPWRTRYGLVSDILTPQRIGLGLLALVLLATGLLGGWGDALSADEDLPRVEPSATAEAAPFRLVVKKAFHGSELPPAVRPSDGVRYVFVTLEATNTATAPVHASILSGDLAVDVDGLTAANPRVLRVNDGQPARAFSPDVTVPVVVVWEQDASAPAPTALTLTVPGYTFRRSSMDASEDWRDPTPAFRVSLPVNPVPGA